MFKAQAVAGALAGLLVSLPAFPVTPVHKCVVDGAVTYQRDPCPSGQARQAPTPERLNAERRKQAETAGAARTGSHPAGAPSSAKPTSGTTSPDGRDADRPASTAAPHEPAPRFRCDGRKYCSQMASCAEAQYFLANCPGVRMDGDGDGIPCEKQWCSR